MIFKAHIVVIVIIIASRTSAVAQEKALFDPSSNRLIVTLQAEIVAAEEVRPFTVELYNRSSSILKRTTVPVATNGGKTIEFEFPIEGKLDASGDYQIKILSGGVLWRTLKIGNAIQAEFTEIGDLSCKGGIAMFLNGVKADLDAKTKNAEGVDKTSYDFWTPILSFLEAPDLRKKLLVKISGHEELIDLESAKVGNTNLAEIAKVGSVDICLVPRSKSTSGTFNISVQFLGDANSPLPFYLGNASKPFIGKNLNWSDIAAFKSSDALPDSPDKRSLENNLDLGLSFTSAVKVDDQTNKKSRETDGILDLRFAPWLNVIKYNPGDSIIKKWTPIYINSNIATGKITKSTLSLNRVILGTSFEFRYIPSLSTENERLDYSKRKRNAEHGNFIDYYRFKFNAKHSSDRDFKQKEITAEASLSPVWAFLNKPRDARWYLDTDLVTGEKIVKNRTFGWEIIPTIGFQFGKTYSRHNQASAIKESDLIKRLYGEVEMNFSSTSHVSLKIVDSIYERYELDSGRLKNYFKGELYFPFDNPFRGTSNGIFLSFEKGDAPPFSNTVNVLKLGYRIQSTGWNKY